MPGHRLDLYAVRFVRRNTVRSPVTLEGDLHSANKYPDLDNGNVRFLVHSVLVVVTGQHLVAGLEILGGYFCVHAIPFRGAATYAHSLVAILCRNSHRGLP